MPVILEKSPVKYLCYVSKVILTKKSIPIRDS